MAWKKKLIVLSLGYSSSLFALESSFNAMTGSAYDSNTGFAENSVNQVGNLITEFELTNVLRVEPKFNVAYLFKSSINLVQYSNVSLLNESGIRLSAERLWQNSFQYTSPFYVAKVEGFMNSVKDNNRNRADLKVQLVVNKRLNDRIFLTTGMSHLSMKSNWGIQQGQQNRIFVASDLLTRNNVLWYSTLGLTQGTTWSSLQTKYCNGATAVDAWPIIQQAYNIASDVAYNQAFCGQWFSYRLQGVSADVTIGLNRPINRYSSFDLSLVSVIQETTADTGYQRHIIRGAILWQW